LSPRYISYSSRLFFFILRRPPTSPLFPYTTLFRSLNLLLTLELARAALAPPRRSALWLLAGLGLAHHWMSFVCWLPGVMHARRSDRKSTRLNSSHLVISYAVFCLKKKKHNINNSSI